MKKYVDAVMFICSLDCGFTTSIHLYNMLAISKLSYIGSFFLPTRDVMKKEQWCLQKLMSGPWNAIPSNALYAMRDIGLGIEARHLGDVCVSSQVRCANVTSNSFALTLRNHFASLQSDDCTLAALAHLHMGDSFFQTWQNSTSLMLNDVYPSGRPRPGTVLRQSVVYRRLRGAKPRFDFAAFINRRLRFFSIDLENSGGSGHIIETYKKISKSLGLKATSCHFRTIANHWCSSSRFGHARKACWFCGHLTGSANDRVAHSVTCDAFISAFLNHFHIDVADDLARSMLSDLSTLLTFSYHHSPLSPFGIKVVFMYVLACFHAYNRCRHGAAFSARFLTAIFKTICKDSWKMHRLRIQISRYGVGRNCLA